jgi:predicted ester cyclase
MSEQLEQVYRRYIDALNNRRFEDLREFVHDRLVYNGKAMTREEYAAMLVGDVRSIPDLHYDVDLLVVDDDHVACRLWFDCRPQAKFLDIAVDGRRVAFAEHVFYRLREGRIEHVWSLLDKRAIEDQARG